MSGGAEGQKSLCVAWCTNHFAASFFSEVVDAAFKYSLNFVARAHDGSIAGVRLATILHRHDSSNDYVFETQSSEWRVVTLKRLVTHVESKVWELAPSDVNTLLSGLIISVHSAHTRRGLANRLHTRSEEAARLEGCDGAVSTCTAKNSQALLAKLGFKEIFAVQYADWRDENGKVIFKPADGTTKAALVFKRF